ncbi:MAG TPA: pirin family protein [Ferruginibacter sp.]|nr:MAG: pirin family protein [Cyclobacteriaceae bacterium]HMX79474.1 pirin family protein [Ferruginibacter sp.]HNA01092.1 pirin family protein [Ferruginibacter sp.]HNF03509.1 pirin family protein [Ferruginibacter sp.]HNJ29685.1 pirin family protein [Ferruginibacter sp.]
MTTKLYRAADRGTADYGWLKPNYYFSFAQYWDPQKVHFGLLRVLNDDFVAGGGGFPTHPHDNMEIVTIPLTGALQHKDSTGGQGVIKAGDVQIMSAGTGVQHSEFNDSKTDPVTLFQVWVFPKVKNIKPRYDQRSFDTADRKNQWQLVVSPLETDNALWINQDARFALASLDAGKELRYTTAFKGNGIFLVVVNGSVEVNGQVLNKRDAAGIAETDSFTVTATESAELLAIEVPMH